jgi:hypothetical protein
MRGRSEEIPRNWVAIDKGENCIGLKDESYHATRKRIIFAVATGGEKIFPESSSLRFRILLGSLATNLPNRLHIVHQKRTIANIAHYRMVRINLQTQNNKTSSMKEFYLFHSKLTCLLRTYNTDTVSRSVQSPIEQEM